MIDDRSWFLKVAQDENDLHQHFGLLYHIIELCLIKVGTKAKMILQNKSAQTNIFIERCDFEWNRKRK